ncbi:hypothetical protein LTR09_009696 [Extremus antarcticus]|uniref:IBR domain-containing protein n=1 Tax=Extremus antarcticus TaxID=702011 RepID=A0AAJ0D8G9_9PEZI|nr:hypothetical protein LTR09_009696 [Extremus antarcticus]
MSYFHRLGALPLRRTTNARQNDETLRDEQLARQIYEQEKQIEADRSFAESIDEGAEGEISQHEHQIEQDRQLALQLAAEDMAENDPNVDGGENFVGGDNESIEEEEDVEIPPAGDAETATCIACADELPQNELAITACDHIYCSGCAISLDSAKYFLGPQRAEEFEAKAIELTTADRTYCHNQTCSAFIPPLTIRDGVADCTACGEYTCAMCKAAQHAGDCPQDVALQQALEEAERQGWRRSVSAGGNFATSVVYVGRPATVHSATSSASTIGRKRLSIAGHQPSNNKLPDGTHFSQHDRGYRQLSSNKTTLLIKHGSKVSSSRCERITNARIHSGGVGSRAATCVRFVVSTRRTPSASASCAFWLLATIAGDIDWDCWTTTSVSIA